MEVGPSFMHGSEVAPVFVLILVAFGILMGLIVVAIKVFIFCKIFSKAGYCWALGLLMLVPIVNIVMPFMLALGDWPIRKELRLLKQQQEKPEA